MTTIARLSAPLFRAGEWNGFLTLATDNLANIVILPPILMTAFHMPPEIVYGKIMCGIAVSVFVAQGLFVYLAYRLAKATGRDDVTALPYGVSTPVMFVYLFAVIGLVYHETNDPLLAYRASLGFGFIGGLVAMSGALVGSLVQRIAPLPGILGTMGGVALAWIVIVPISIILGNPLIGLPCLFIVLLGLLGNFRFPFNAPAMLVTVLVGIAIGAFTGESTIHVEVLAMRPPLPVLDDLWIGLREALARPEILAVVIPVQVYNFMETIGNVEMARTAGDTYNVRTSLLLDGFGTCLAAMFGSPFSTTVYLGHPGYKQMGGRRGYAMMSGLFLLAASIGGFFAFFQHLIPTPSVAALIVFIGLASTAYPFQVIPVSQAAAIVTAFIPHIGDLMKKQLDGTLAEVLPAGAINPGLMTNLANNQAVYLSSYGLLSHGAIITGLLWGSIVAFLIDKQLGKAVVFTAVAAGLSALGFIHADKLGLYMSPITGAYIILAVLLAASWAWERRQAALPTKPLPELAEADSGD